MRIYSEEKSNKFKDLIDLIDLIIASGIKNFFFFLPLH